MEFSGIIEQAYQHFKAGKKAVLATIVALDGSSYRKEGTRMLMAEDGQMTFALSGGCIEMYVFRQAASVFANNQAKVIVYDGRERLGCEGQLYILLEPVVVDDAVYQLISDLESGRQPFELVSFYKKEDLATGNFGTVIFKGDSFEPEGNWQGLDLQSREASVFLKNNPDYFKQAMYPPFKLLLFGGGHDVQSFSKMADNLGWDVTVVLCEESPRQAGDFPRATKVLRATGKSLDALHPDLQTAAVVMTHNFEKDLDYVKGLLNFDLAYLGMIGSLKRRTKLENEFLMEGLDSTVMSRIYTPAGLDIGAENPEEIALSILAEILAVTRHRDGKSLKHKKGVRIGVLNSP